MKMMMKFKKIQNSQIIISKILQQSKVVKLTNKCIKLKHYNNLVQLRTISRNQKSQEYNDQKKV